MKARLVLSAGVSMCLLLGACGGSGRSGVSTDASPSANAAGAAYTDQPRPRRIAENEKGTENDGDEHHHYPAPSDDHHNGLERSFGHLATGTEKQAIEALLRRYYAAATTEDGAKACTMLNPKLRKVVPLDYGQFGPPYRHHDKTCPAVLSDLFRHEHRLLVRETPHLEFLSVNVEGAMGLVLLGFGPLPERQFRLVREGGKWTASALLDAELA